MNVLKLIIILSASNTIDCLNCEDLQCEFCCLRNQLG